VTLEGNETLPPILKSSGARLALATADQIASLVLRGLGKRLFSVVVALFGVGWWAAVFAEIFEYGEWTSDLSQAEILYLCVIVLLEIRHFSYCRSAGVGVVRAFLRQNAVFGMVGMVLTSAAGLYAMILVFTGGDISLLLDLMAEPSTSDKLWRMALTLLILYGSSPVLPRDGMTQR